jgi:DHA2 family multidrug resistance protein-like MFS transporter
MFVVGLDLTVLNLALPKIATALHASASDLQWFNSAYSLVIAAAILPAGLLGDRYGRKKVLLTALVLFGALSAGCAYAASSGELIAARAALGLGAAAIMPLALAVIPVLFRTEEQQKATAVMAATIFISFPIGPLVGGALLDHFWWGSVFLINVPVVVLALIAIAILMPESRSERRPSVDVPGVLISSLGLTGVTYGFIKAGQDGWGSATALAALGAGAVMLAGFPAWERQAGRRGGTAGQRSRTPAAGGRSPLVELPLFRSAGFTFGSLLATLVSFAMFGIMYAMPQYFQEVRGTDAFGSGLRMLPMIGGMLVGMVLGTRLQAPRKDGTAIATAKSVVTAGFAIMAAALMVGAFSTGASGAGFTAAWFAVAGSGLGLAMPSAMTAALGALSAERSGSGSAVITAMRQVGATIGVAILGTVLLSGYRDRLDVAGLSAQAAGTVRSGVTGGVGVATQLRSAPLLDSVRNAFTGGMDVMLWTCGGIAVASALLALAFLPRRVGDAAGAPAAEAAEPGHANWAGHGGAGAAEQAELTR